jgi:hypothetical protein
MAKLEDFVPYPNTKESDWTDVERPLQLRIQPGAPDRTLLLWKGVPMGMIDNIEISLSSSHTKIYLVKRCPANHLFTAPSISPAWEEMAAAGIQIVEQT